jgi:hypothetical protein
MDLTSREVMLSGVDWIYMTEERDWQQAVVNMVMNFWHP